jgi:hypothetical protein
VREHKTPFEIHVYEYEELPPGGFTLEGHFNFVGIGTNSFDGLVALTNHQFHMAGELTGGITDNVSLGFMLLSAVRPGGPGLEYACWRVLPHFYAPKSWHLPLELGLVGEFSFQRTKKQNSVSVYQISFRANWTSLGCVARLSICPAPTNDPSWLNNVAPAWPLIGSGGTKLE